MIVVISVGLAIGSRNAFLVQHDCQIRGADVASAIERGVEPLHALLESRVRRRGVAQDAVALLLAAFRFGESFAADEVVYELASLPTRTRHSPPTRHSRPSS